MVQNADVFTDEDEEFTYDITVWKRVAGVIRVEASNREEAKAIALHKDNYDKIKWYDGESLQVVEVELIREGN